MSYVVELLFDDYGQAIINEIRNVLVANGIPDKAVPTNHISIGDFTVSDYEALKRSVITFAKKIKPFEVSLCMVGTFMTEKNVIFLSPVMTDELKEVHDNFIKSVPDMKEYLIQYYDINKWIAHCTIAIRLSDEELLKGIEIIKKHISLPIKVKIDKIDILKCPSPYEQVFVTTIG